MIALRRLPAGTAVCSVLLAACCVAAPQAVPVAKGPAEATYAYGGHPRQRLTAYWETGSAARRAVVILHGGSWTRDRDWSGWARTLAALGHPVFEVDYRRNSDAHWPAQRRDALTALRWIRRHAARFAAAPVRPVLFGSSAGGQIAAAVGTYGAGGRRVVGVVALSPPASPYRAWRDGGRPGAGVKRRALRREAERLIGCRPAPGRDACRRIWRDAAARTHASGRNDAPMYLLHSRGDFVPVTHSRDLAAAERAAGASAGRARVAVVPGSAHGGAMLERSGVAAGVLRWISARH